MMLVGRRLAHVIEEKNRAEAELKSRAAQLRHCGEGAAIATDVMNKHSFVNSALEGRVVLARVVPPAHAHHFCHPFKLCGGAGFALVICIPKYLGGAMSLGEVVQAAAAFVIVQGALNWFVDNYQRLADLLSSMNRVSSLLLALDQLGHTTDQANGHLAPGHAQFDAPEQGLRHAARSSTLQVGEELMCFEVREAVSRARTMCRSRMRSLFY